MVAAKADIVGARDPAAGVAAQSMLEYVVADAAVRDGNLVVVAAAAAAVAAEGM